MWRRTLFLPLLLTGCLAQKPVLPANSNPADQLLRTGLNELVENRQPKSLESLLETYPQTQQAALAQRLLLWKHQQTQAPATTTTTTTTTTATTPRKVAGTDTEIRDLKEENRRLRSDLEQLRRLLIESERRAR